MIGCVLLIWVGINLSAPWWFYALLAVRAVLSMIDLGIKIGKAGKK